MFGGQDMSQFMTPAAKKYKCYCWIYILLASIMAIVKIVTHLDDFMQIFFIAIMAGLLWCALSQMSYSMLTFFLIYLMYPQIMDFFEIGAISQDFNARIIDKSQCGDNCNSNQTIFIVSIVDFFVQWIGVFFIFLEYREFKAITQDKMGGGNYMAMAQGGQNNAGGGMETPNDDGWARNQAPAQNNNDAPANAQANNRGYTAFQGRGVTLGGN